MSTSYLKAKGFTWAGVPDVRQFLDISFHMGEFYQQQRLSPLAWAPTAKGESQPWVCGRSVV